MRRREFIAYIGSAVAWPLAARAQQPAMPIVGFINAGVADTSAGRVAAFRKGLSEAGYAEGQNVLVEYHWLEGDYERLPAVVADLVQRRVAVIATPGSQPATLAAKAATAMIPIVFSVGEDPVKPGLVVSLARPGGNATGINFFGSEVVAKRLGLLHDLVPKAVRIAVLINPANTAVAEATLRDIPEAARALGLQIQVLNASTNREIEAAFAILVRDRTDALFVALAMRGYQFGLQRDKVPPFQKRVFHRVFTPCAWVRLASTEVSDTNRSVSQWWKLDAGFRR
jgi:putative tryptophan/tyrosine transport system substrate-binding protein